MTKSGGGVDSDDGRDVKISNSDFHNLLYGVSETSTVLTVTFTLVWYSHTEAREVVP